MRDSYDGHWHYSMNLRDICFRLLEMFFTCLDLPRNWSLFYFLYSACPNVSGGCLLSELTLEEFVINSKDNSHEVEFWKGWDNQGRARMSQRFKESEVRSNWGQGGLWSKSLMCAAGLAYCECHANPTILGWDITREFTFCVFLSTPFLALLNTFSSVFNYRVSKRWVFRYNGHLCHQCIASS